MRSARAGYLVPAVIAALLLAALAVGCGDDDDGDVETVTVQETVTGGEGTETAETTATTAFEERTGLSQFVTPSGNIGCYISDTGARCDISDRLWAPTPEPASCKKLDVDYGQGIEVDADDARFVCAGDTVLGGSDTLEYGQAAVAGQFRCESAEDGVTCSDTDGRPGFFISRESYSIRHG